MKVPVSSKSVKFLQFFGLCPFYWICSTNIVVKLIITSYSFLLYGFLLHVAFSFNLPTFKNLMKSDFNFDAFVFIARVINCLIGYLIIPLLYWRWSSRLSKYCNEWFKFYASDKFSLLLSVDGLKNETGTSEVLLKVFLLMFCGITLILAEVHQPDVIFSYGLVMMFGILSFLWNETCNTITETLNLFRLLLENSPKGIKVFDFRIENLTSCWILFCQLVKSSCLVYSDLLFSSIQSMTLLIMFNIYTLFTQVVQKKLDIHEYFHSTTLIILAAINIYVICNKSHCTEKQLKTTIRDRILYIGIFLSETEKLMKIKQTLYVIQITTPSICLYNFMSIDRPLMMNLLSIVVTYLVVLIQFEITSVPLHWNITTTYNNRTDLE